MDRNLCMSCLQRRKSHPVCEHCGFDERKPNLDHQLPMGTVLHNQYRIGRVLGQGGFGITYAGWDQTLQMPVAIKELFPKGMVSRNCQYSRLVSDTEGDKWADLVVDIRRRFLQEARVLAQLSHVTEIVNVRYFFEENNTAYIIMEFLRGTDLKHHIQARGGKLSVRETLEIMKPVIKALSVVHQNNLVHRDISPDNIMMMPGDRVKLLDFGAAKSVENADPNAPLLSSTQTILKHGFAPIEQYQSRGSLGPWTDVYALCATIYFCLTGQVPPEAPRRVIEDIHPNWGKITDLTEQQRRTLEKGMAVRAKDRIASMEELYNALYQSADDHERRQDTGKTIFACPVCGDWMDYYGTCGRCGHDMRLRNNPQQLRVGMELRGRYRVGQVLGWNGFDITYKGWDRMKQRSVVIREFHLKGMMERNRKGELHASDKEPGWREFAIKSYYAFLQTGRNLEKMGHIPEVPRMEEVFAENGTAYMVMEFVQGMKLYQYVQTHGGRLGVAKTLALLEPAVRAMTEVHKAGEIHRDISPENIKITPESRVKIIDFCFTAEVRTPWELRQREMVPLSVYLPPELYTASYGINASQDVYAMCATIYFCITGQQPPDAPSRNRKELNPDWNSIPGLTDRQRYTLKRGMALRPEDRISNMEELYDGLYRWEPPVMYLP